MQDTNFIQLQQAWASNLRDLHQGIGTIDRALALACQQVSDPEVLAQLQLAQGATAALGREVGRQVAVIARLQPIEPQAKAFGQALSAKRNIARRVTAAKRDGAADAVVDATQEAADFEEVAQQACRVMLQEIATAER